MPVKSPTSSAENGLRSMLITNTTVNELTGPFPSIHHLQCLKHWIEIQESAILTLNNMPRGKRAINKFWSFTLEQVDVGWDLQVSRFLWFDYFDFNIYHIPSYDVLVHRSLWWIKRWLIFFLKNTDTHCKRQSTHCKFNSTHQI